MADFFKGLAGGFGTGLQFGQAMRERNMRDELAQAYAKPETYTDYTPEQVQQIQGLQASGAYDVTAVPGAEGQAPTLRYAPRPGLDTGEVPMQAGAGIEIAPSQVQRYGGQTTAGQFDPTALRGLQMQEAARVLGSYGDVRGAAALQAQAEEQAYQAKRRPMELAGLERQAKLGGIQLTEAERKVKLDEANRAAQTMLAERAAAGTPIDTATANQIAKDTGADMTFVTDAVLKQYNLTKESANDLIQRQLTDFNKAAEGGVPTLNKYIAERLDPDKTDNIVPTIVQGKDGKLRVMYGDKPLPGYQAYGDLNQLSAAFQGNIKRDPLGAAIQISTLETQAQARRASEAQIEASKAQTEATGQKGLSKKVSAMEEILGRKLTEPEKLTLFTIAPKPREVSSEAVASLAKEMVGKPTGTMKDGKPEKYTVASAAAAARQALSAGPTADMQPVNSIIAAMQKNAAASQQRATPAGQQLVGLANTMLPPVAAPQPMPTTSAERLRQLSLGQPRQQ